MASSLTLTNLLDKYPSGTTIGAFKQSNWATYQFPPSGAPVGSSDATGSVSASGAVTLTGLTDDTDFFLVQPSGGTYAYTRASTRVSHAGFEETVGGDLGGSLPNVSVKAIDAQLAPAPTGADRAALQSLIDNSPYAVGVVDIALRPGTYVLDATGPLTLPKSAVGLKIRGAGIGSTVIQLSASAPRAFDFAASSAGDTFQNIELADFTVDAQNLGGQHHVVLGTYQGGTIRPDLNFSNIALRRIKTVNVLTDSNTGTNHRLNFYLTSRQTADDGTARTITDILCEACDFQGGNMGYAVLATAPTTGHANVLVDRVKFVRCRFDGLTTPTTVYNSACFFIGSSGYGGHYEVLDCYGANSGDVGIELDAPTTALVSGTVIQDCITSHFYVQNYHTPDNTEFQRATFRDCHARVVNLNPKASTYNAAGFAGPGAAPTFGEMLLDGCTYLNKSTNCGAAGMAINSTGALKRLTTRNFRITHDTINYANSTGADRNPSYVEARHTVDNTTVIDGLSYRIGGTFSGTDASATTLKVIRLSPNNAGATQTLSVKRVREDINLTGISGATSTYGLRVGETAGVIRGVIEDISTVGYTGPDARFMAIDSAAVANIAPKLTIRNCDWSKRTGSSADIVFVAATQPKVLLQDNALRSGTYDVASATTVTLTNTPYQNITGTVTITGVTAMPLGTVVTLKFAGILTFTDGLNLLLNGNFVTTADDTITLVSDGTNWYEIGRSAN